MPLVKISLRKGRSSDYKQALLDGVHSALVEAFRIPDHDRHQLLNEQNAEDFEISPKNSDRFVLIEIIAFPGRSSEAQKKLYTAIVRNFRESPGIDGNDILIIIHEPPLENWGIRGGRPASEVDVGFKINV